MGLKVVLQRGVLVMHGQRAYILHEHGNHIKSEANRCIYASVYLTCDEI